MRFTCGPAVQYGRNRLIERGNVSLRRPCSHPGMKTVSRFGFPIALTSSSPRTPTRSEGSSDETTTKGTSIEDTT